jgi:triosephosphate isomerase (TIM)
MTKTRRSRTSSSVSGSSSGSTRTGKSSSTATSTRSAPARSASASPWPTSAPLGAPLFVLNLKAYPNCFGAGARTIAATLAGEAQRRRIDAAICPSAPDLTAIAAETSLAVLAQHVDSVDAGARTGWLVVEALRAAGCRGSLLNHSERPLSHEEVADAVTRLHSVGLAAIVCAKDVEDSRSLARTHPAYLAVEPPELIGGDTSVATAQPEVVRGSVAAVHEVSPTTRVLCGAGVHDRNDVRIAIGLGAEGVLVASAVARAADPLEAITELLSGFPVPRTKPR